MLSRLYQALASIISVADIFFQPAGILVEREIGTVSREMLLERSGKQAKAAVLEPPRGAQGAVLVLDLVVQVGLATSSSVLSSHAVMFFSNQSLG